MIIDFHIHAGDLDDLTPWAKDYFLQFTKLMGVFEGGALIPEKLINYLDNCCVDYAVVLPEYSPKAYGTVTVEKAYSLCKTSKKFILFSNINPWITKNPVRVFLYEYERFGSRGVKLHPVHQSFYPNDRLLYPLYEKLEELELPLLVHTGSSIFHGAKARFGNPLYLDEVAADFPQLNIVLAHGGRGYFYREAEYLAESHENVFIEVSGLPPFKLTEYFPSISRNHQKFIFASDWPGIKDLKKNISDIKALPLDENALENILFRNAAKLLKIDERDCK
ncbi:MAG: amidohydrolase family protein [Candidatus Aenigmatarchaeota archaeon]